MIQAPDGKSCMPMEECGPRQRRDEATLSCENCPAFMIGIKDKAHPDADAYKCDYPKCTNELVPDKNGICTHCGACSVKKGRLCVKEECDN